MIVGPILTRELVTSPRRVRHYLARSAYVGILFVLMWTAWQAVVGLAGVDSVGSLARFGTILFQVLAYVQLSLVCFFAPLYAASSICAEKDRRTLVLLLMTDLYNHELVLGKLLASLLQVGVMLLAAVPLFCACVLLGGVSLAQAALALAVTVAAAMVTGSLGALVAFWRDKTYQALAITLLTLVLVVALLEGVSAAYPHAVIGPASLDGWRLMLNPFRAMWFVAQPLAASAATLPGIGSPAVGYMVTALVVSAVLNVASVLGVRRWNTTTDRGTARDESDSHVADDSPQARAAAHAEPQPTRTVWDNPVLWRELRTRAYGRRILLIKAAYVLLFALVVAYLVGLQNAPGPVSPIRIVAALVPLVIVSLFLINAQAVTSVTTERDSRALDLLLVTDLQPKEFIVGKVVGVVYNSAPMIVLPLALIVYLLAGGLIAFESFLFLFIDTAILMAFAVALGIHHSMAYDQTRLSLANSLGTIFFLFIGLLICIYLIIIGGGSFGQQVTSFILFVIAGSVGLWGSLSRKNPSHAIMIVAAACPFSTFYCVTAILLGETFAPFLVSATVYGFAVCAFLVPAVAEFDVTLGRTTTESA